MRRRFFASVAQTALRQLLVAAQAGQTVFPSLQNILPNPTGAGAVAGTGTDPTGWVVSTTSNGLTSTIAEIGIEEGIPFVAINWAGETTNNGNVITYFNTPTASDATVGQKVRGGVYVQLSDGDLTGITANALRLVERNEAGGFPTGNTFDAQTFTPDGSALSAQRVTVEHVQSIPEAVHSQFGHRFDYTTGQTVDVTFKYGLPTLDLLALNYFFDVATVIAAGAGGNTASAAAAAPTLAYNVTNKELWPGYGDDIGEWGDIYMLEGASSVQAADNVRDWVFDFADNGYMRVNSETTLEDGELKDFVSERNWAMCSLLPAYLKTQASASYSAADRAAIVAWVSGVCDDIMEYYDGSSGLGSAHNNHMMWATLAAITGAVITSRQDVFDYALNNVKHILDDTFSDVIAEDAVQRRLVGYGSPPMDTHPPGGLQLELDRGNDAFFYQSYWLGTAIVVAAIARKNGQNLFAYEGTYGTLHEVADFWQLNVDDGGDTIIAILDDWQPAEDRPDNAAALDVATHATDADKFASFLIYATLFPLASAATDMLTNMDGGSNTQLGGDIGYLVDNDYIT